MSATCGEAVRAQQVARRRSARTARGGPRPPPRPSSRWCTPRAPSATGAARARAHQQEADVRVLAQGGDQRRGGAPRSPRASAGGARPSGRRGPGCPTPSTIASLPPTSLAGARIGSAPTRSPRATAWPTAVSFSSPPPSSATLPVGERALDQVVEAVAVALQEGGALGLPVVGEDDDLVGARRVAARRGRSARTAGRACAAPRACRRARGRSGGPPRRSRRRSRRPRGGPFIMSLSTPKTIRSRTATHIAARRNG